MDILLIGDKRLTLRADEVVDFSEMETITEEMKTFATESGGLIGLAATQVGVMKRVFIVRYVNSDGVTDWLVFVNPKIKVNKDKGTSWQWEGCGSIPGSEFLVERFNSLTVVAQNVHGVEFGLDASGALARVIQHENDHLNGKLLTMKRNRGMRKA